MRRYSRLRQIEERKNIKNAYYYIFLSITAVLFLIFFGLPTIVKLAGFVGDLAKSDKAIELNDITPPAPPHFDEIPEYTNIENLDITGRSENGATIIITANGDVSEVVANSDGNFTFVFNLQDGENMILAKAKDQAGNESQPTKEFKIVYDNDEPELTITSPADGSSYYGTGQKQVSITGNVDEEVSLSINERSVEINDDNTFKFNATLSEGENKYEIKATDPSGNETSITLTLNFSL